MSQSPLCPTCRQPSRPALHYARYQDFGHPDRATAHSFYCPRCMEFVGPRVLTLFGAAWLEACRSLRADLPSANLSLDDTPEVWP